MLQIGDAVVSLDVLREYFVCDLEACRGICCIEGDSGAPVLDDEVERLDEVLPVVWDDLSDEAREVIRRQGTTYVDADGDRVTSIVDGRDCVFTCHEDGVCLCLLEKAYRDGRSKFCKPVSCALYPIRERTLSNGLAALNYHRWSVCEAARTKGRELGLHVYEFLKGPLVRRFGQEWYDELAAAAQLLNGRQAGR